MKEALAEANKRLKSASIRASLIQRGSFLSLRAQLPSRTPGEPHKRQTLALHTFATPAGIRKAEKLAHKIMAQVALGEFNWADWIAPPNTQAPKNCGDWIATFNTDYLQRGGKKAGLAEYQKTFNRLNPAAQLTPDLLLDAVLGTTPNTRTREKTVMHCTALAKLAGIEVDLKAYRGHYTPAPRTLPSDSEIAQWRTAIDLPQWRWAYGMMAAYGLRNHEVFRLEGFRGAAAIIGDDTKTGHREVLPFYPEWAEQWSLTSPNPPHLNTARPNAALGHAVTTAFRRANIPFNPYDLRHAWAVRAIGFLLPIDIRARMMGHSIEVHTRTYQKWIRQDEIDRLYTLLLSRSDRPQPPPPIV